MNGDEAMTELLARRSFLAGATAALICAPSIVRAASLMPVRNMGIRLAGVSWKLSTPDEILDDVRAMLSLWSTEVINSQLMCTPDFAAEFLNP
jgi:hypothetical protein